MSSKGLAHEMRTLEGGSPVFLLPLPLPQKPKSLYFLELVYKRQEQRGMIKKQNTRLFTLDRIGDEKGNFTVVGEVTPRLVYHELVEGPMPKLDAFFDSVCSVLDKKNDPARCIEFTLTLTLWGSCR